MIRAARKSFSKPSTRSNIPTQLPPATQNEVNQEAAAEEAPFRFLDLPPELRNLVYNLVFTAEDYDFVDGRGQVRIQPRTMIFKAKKANRSESAILQTCRQICEEAKMLPFSYNYFRFPTSHNMDLFTDKLSNEQLHAVTRVTIDYCGSDLEKCFGKPIVFPGFEVLRVLAAGCDCWDSMHYLIDEKVERIVKDVRGVQDLNVVCVYSDATEDEKAMARRLQEVWMPIVTRTKLRRSGRRHGGRSSK